MVRKRRTALSKDRPGAYDDGTLRRRVSILALIPGALFGCEQRFSSDALTAENFAPLPSSGVIDAGAAPGATAGPLDLSHAMTVTTCASSPQPCPAPEGDAGANASYRVVFGSGRAVVRSHGQAMTDLYQELRDRTASGGRLDAEPLAGTADAGPIVLESRSPPSGDGDPITQAAFRLLYVVDRFGGVTIDVVRGIGSRGCTVSLGRSADGGSSQCLVQDPERPQGPGPKGPGVSW